MLCGRRSNPSLTEAMLCRLFRRGRQVLVELLQGRTGRGLVGVGFLRRVELGNEVVMVP